YLSTRETKVVLGLLKKVKPPVPLDKLKPADPAAMIERLKGKYRIDAKTDGKPIVVVNLDKTKVTDRDLAELRDLKHLQELNLEAANMVTDAGLFYLQGLTNLSKMNLRGT